jgi:hypothetical protein
MDFILSTSNFLNGFDDYGHYLRAQIQITNCIDYEPKPTPGCTAKWGGLAPSSAPVTADSLQNDSLPGVSDGDWNGDGKIDKTDTVLGRGVADMQAQLGASTGDAQGAAGGADTAAAANPDLFKFLMGDGR